MSAKRNSRVEGRKKGYTIMHGIDTILSLIDYALDTPRKRHVTGGILISASLLFGGLAVTVITVKKEENDDE